VQFGSDDLAKYSFLAQAGDYVREQGISVVDLVKPEYTNVIRRAEGRVIEAIRSGKVSDKTDEREIEIMSFPVSLMLVRATKLEHLMDRYALAEAMRVESFLNQERKEKVIEDIFTNVLNIRLERTSSSSLPNFQLDLSDYVSRATAFHAQEWKLVNKTVHKGKVYVSQHDLIRLIREEIRDLIMQRLKAVTVPKLPKELDEISKKLIELTPPPRTAYAMARVDPENYPPCLKEALSLLSKGQNVPHYGRFLMATYLLAVGKTVDEIMALFPKSPDFKLSVTKYQVEHIAGLKGGRTKYSVPLCKTLQTHSFCFKDPIKCYEINSPLQYPSRRAPGEERTGLRSQKNGKEERRGWTKTRR
jgi:DNA primase large subunit